MNQSLSTTANTTVSNAKSTLTNAFTKNGALSIAGISLPEIAVLGAAGYVLWKNRTQIQTILEKGGVEVPSIMGADMNELIATGAAFIAKTKRSLSESESSSKDSGSSNKDSSSMNAGSSNANSGSTDASSSSLNSGKSGVSGSQFGSKDASKKSSVIHDA